MLVQLEQHKDLIKAAGLKNVALGIGQPKHAAHFGGKLAPSVLCLSNETNAVHFLFGLKRAGIEQMLNPKLYIASAKAAATGLTQGHATGDTAMLGGVFMIDAAGVIRYITINEYAGDYPPIPEILAQVLAANSISHNVGA
jgi:hypothetical protein